DAKVGGPVNEQQDPQLADPNHVPRAFAFADDDVVKRRVTTCQILAYYRQVYTPGPGSKLIDGGDPQDGRGNGIGAVGAGTPNAGDKFGTLCDPNDVGVPTADPAMFTCPAVPLGADPGVPIGPPPVAKHGVTCVCEVGSGAPEPLGLALAAAL